MKSGIILWVEVCYYFSIISQEKAVGSFRGYLQCPGESFAQMFLNVDEYTSSFPDEEDVKGRYLVIKRK